MEWADPNVKALVLKHKVSQDVESEFMSFTMNDFKKLTKQDLTEIVGQDIALSIITSIQEASKNEPLLTPTFKRGESILARYTDGNYHRAVFQRQLTTEGYRVIFDEFNETVDVTQEDLKTVTLDENKPFPDELKTELFEGGSWIVDTKKLDQGWKPTEEEVKYVLTDHYKGSVSNARRSITEKIKNGNKIPRVCLVHSKSKMVWYKIEIKQKEKTGVTLSPPMSPPSKSSLKNINQSEIVAQIQKKKDSKRRKIIEELYSTEVTYVEQLQALETLYIEPLKKQVNILPLAKSDILFSNITSIKTINESFLKELKELVESEKKEHQEVGQILCDFFPFIGMYSDYAKFHSEAVTLLEKLLSPNGNSKFRQFCANAAVQPQSKMLNLASLLIVPIQRVPRYLMLLKEIIKCTPDDHSDMEKLKEAEKMIAVAAKGVDEAIRAKMSGWLSKRGEINKSWKSRWFVLQDGTVTYYSSEKCNQNLGSFSVNGSRVVSFDAKIFADEQRKGAIFGVTPWAQYDRHKTFKQRQYILEAENYETRQKWRQILLVHGAVDDGAVDESGPNIPDALLEGWLTKKGDRRRNWTSRYFVLLPHQFMYYKQKPQSITQLPTGVIPLSDISTVCHTTEQKPYSFAVLPEPNVRAYRMCAEDNSKAQEWVEIIQSLINSKKKLTRATMCNVESKEEVKKPPKIEGWLSKKGKNTNTWRNEYFILNCPELRYYKEKPKSHGGGTLISLTSSAIIQEDKTQRAFAITPNNETGTRKYIMRSSNNKEMANWISTLNQSVKYMISVQSQNNALMGSMDNIVANPMQKRFSTGETVIIVKDDGVEDEGTIKGPLKDGCWPVATNADAPDVISYFPFHSVRRKTKISNLSPETTRNQSPSVSIVPPPPDEMTRNQSISLSNILPPPPDDMNREESIAMPPPEDLETDIMMPPHEDLEGLISVEISEIDNIIELLRSEGYKCERTPALTNS